MIRICPHTDQQAMDALSRRLGLGDWLLTIQESDAPGGSTRNAGLCQKDPNTLEAVLTIRRDQGGNERLDTLTHECLHVALAEIDQAVEDCILELLPAELQDHARRLYNNALERTIVRLARGLAPVIAR